MAEPSWLKRVIEYFSNESDELIGKFVLPQTELATLQSLWDVPPDDPMVECLPVKAKQASFLRELVGLEFDFAQHSYFLVAYTTDWEATKREGGYLGLFPPPQELLAFPDAKRVIPKTSS